MEVREYIIKVQDGDMDDELEADLYDKLTKLTADDIQEVVNAIDNLKQDKTAKILWTLQQMGYVQF